MQALAAGILGAGGAQLLLLDRAADWSGCPRTFPLLGSFRVRRRRSHHQFLVSRLRRLSFE
jgi:hypothetical protein